MLFNSLEFLVFAPIFFALYFLVRGRTRLILIALASFFFYAWWDWRFTPLLLFVTLLHYWTGIRIEEAAGDRPRQKRILVLSIAIGLGLLAIFKYTNFFIGIAYDALHTWVPGLNRPMMDIVLPAGISFYTFQTMAYSIDVYRGIIQHAERNIWRFASFASIFPHLVAGPIVRASSLLPQLRVDHEVDWGRIARGLELVVWGYFLKVCLADTAATVVAPRFEVPDMFGSLAHIIGVLAFALQIYGDFAGYSLIAIGLGRIMGFDFGINFNRPYFARSFSDFWMRWHISLSSWLRDYLYIPLGGNRGGAWNTARNLMITMFLGGLWHGASWNFVLWGLLHGLYLVLQRVVSPGWQRLLKALRIPGFLAAAIEMLVVFTLTCFAWIFFRAQSFEDAWRIISIILQFEDMQLHMSQHLISIAKTATFAVAVFAVDALGAREAVREYYLARPALRVGGALILVWTMILTGTYAGSSFLYFQF
jgi:D-alanyl-lipoteichoic acid acyltransferase DltB (MBOAT superfamily)